MTAKREDLGALLARLAGGGAVLAIDAKRLSARLDAGSVRDLESVEPDALADAGVHDTVIVGGGLGELSPLDVARQLRSRLKPRGTLVFAVPTVRAGLAGATGSLLGFLRRKRRLAFEELCEALLIAGYEEIEARELDGASGQSAVWGRAPG